LKLILLSALLTALSMPGMLWGYLIWIALIPFFLGMRSSRPLGGALKAFLFGFAYLMITHYWELPVLALNVPEVLDSFPNFIGVVVYVLMCLVIAVPFAGFGFVYSIFWRFFQTRKFTGALFAASLFTVFEGLRELGPLGFTNGRLSDALLNSQLGISQLLALGGPLLLVFVVVLVNHYLADLCARRKGGRISLLVTALAMVALVNALIQSAIPLRPTDESSEKTLYALQTNISQQLKYYAPPEETLKVVLMGLEEIPEGSTVIMPEATFMSDIRITPTGARLVDIARERNLEILVGFPIYNGENYNQVRFVNGDGFSGEFYAKVKLTPFVEFLPWPKIFGAFEFLKFLDYFDAGEEFTVFSVDGHEIGAQICFDSLYSEVARNLTLNGAGIIVISTNDGWFNIETALQQHFSKGIARAIENRRYVLQVSNTGITAIIDPYGRVLKRLPTINEVNTEYVIGAFQYLPGTQITPYTRFGNWFFFFSLVLGIAIAILGGVFPVKHEDKAKEILSTFKRIVVVGFSKNPDKPSNNVPMYLKEKGYEIIPVNPTMEEYEGMKVYPDLKSVIADGMNLEAVEIFRPSAEAEEIAIEAIELGARAVWLQKNIRSEKARKLASERSVLYVEDKCMYVEHRRFFT